MALTSDHRSILSPVTRSTGQVTQHLLAPPGLLRCLIVSWSDRRMNLLRASAKSEAWDAIACSDSTQFLRNVFQQKIPLTVVDLPPASNAIFMDLRLAAERAKEISDTLLVLSVADGDANVELWARQLGVWSYLPELSRQEGWELVFREARQAMARQASAYLESTTLESNGPAMEDGRHQKENAREGDRTKRREH